jgi:hypothetical protein
MKEQCPQLHTFYNHSTGPAMLKIHSQRNTSLHSLHQSRDQGKVPPKLDEECPQLHAFHNHSTGPAMLKIHSLNTLTYISMFFPQR